VRLVITAVLALAWGGAAVAAPPPPAIYPADRPQTLDGYDVARLYRSYWSWALRGRGDALKRSLRIDDQWLGKRWWGAPARSTLGHYDFGAIRDDRLDLYCDGDPVKNEAAGSCAYRYQYAFVPDLLATSKPLHDAIDASFRPEELIALLKRQGYRPDEPDRSSEKLFVLFAKHTSRTKLYLPFVERHDTGSSTCPQLAKAVAGLGKITLDLAPVPATFADVPSPHGALTEVELDARTEAGRSVTIRGTTALHAQLQPLWDAAEACSPPSYAPKTAE